RALQQVFQMIEMAIEMKNRRLQALLPREGQHLTRQRLAAARGGGDRVDGAAIMLVLETMRENLGLAAHDHEDVVEVMRDAAGETAERLDLLRMRQLLARLLQRGLHLALARDVPRHFAEADERPGAVADRVEHDAGPELRSVLAHAPALGLVA